MQERTIFFIYGPISLLIQEIFAYIYIIYPIKDFEKNVKEIQFTIYLMMAESLSQGIINLQ